MPDELEDLLNSNYKFFDRSEAVSDVPKRPGRDKISYHSNKSGVDEKLVRALIGQESNDNPRARSWANNQGRMQVSQDVVNRFVKEKEFGSLDPMNEDVNLAAGTRYLKWLSDRYGGDIKRTLAGYNAGEGNADKKDWWEQSLKWSNLREVQQGLKPRGYRGSTREYIDRISSKYDQQNFSAPGNIDSLIENYSSDDKLGNLDDLLSNYAPEAISDKNPLVLKPSMSVPGMQRSIITNNTQAAKTVESIRALGEKKGKTPEEIQERIDTFINGLPAAIRNSMK